MFARLLLTTMAVFLALLAPRQRVAHLPLVLMDTRVRPTPETDASATTSSGTSLGAADNENRAVENDRPQWPRPSEDCAAFWWEFDRCCECFSAGEEETGRALQSLGELAERAQRPRCNTVRAEHGSSYRPFRR